LRRGGPEGCLEPTGERGYKAPARGLILEPGDGQRGGSADGAAIENCERACTESRDGVDAPVGRGRIGKGINGSSQVAGRVGRNQKGTLIWTGGREEGRIPQDPRTWDTKTLETGGGGEKNPKKKKKKKQKKKKNKKKKKKIPPLGRNKVLGKKPEMLSEKRFFSLTENGRK